MSEIVAQISAEGLHHNLCMRIQECKNTPDVPIFSHVYELFLNDYKTVPLAYLTRILNTKIDSWYYGNCISDFILAVFLPNLLSDSFTGQLPTFLTNSQVHDAYLTLYRMVHFFMVDVSVIDYYHEPYYISVAKLREGRMFEIMPDHVKAAITPFYVLLKHGNRLILLQEAMMRRFILRKRKERQTRAYEIIANWWFEIINSPYTELGQRMLAKRAQRFHRLATAIVG